MAIYKRALTANERAWFYNSGARQADIDIASSYTAPSYTYNANGNTLAPHCVPRHRPPGQVWCSAGVTQRVEGGPTYIQTFDAENRLISVTVSGQP